MPRCINDLCSLLGYSRQSYYQGIKYIHQKAYQADVIIEEVLRYRSVQKRIGTCKLLYEMKDFLTAHSFRIGRDAMFDLLGEYDLLIKNRKRKGHVTTFSKHRFRRYPNIIKEFVPDAPNQLWVSDITYIHLQQGFAYLSLITDSYSRKIVGFCLSDDLSAKGPLRALKMALSGNPNHDALIHHSDRGVQYCCDEYVKLLQDNHISISMTEKGDPLENAIAERVNGILKTELLEPVSPDFIAAQKQVATACSIYNHLRPHASVDNLKPAEAHQLNGALKKRWKNYYRINQQKKEVQMLL